MRIGRLIVDTASWKPYLQGSNHKHHIYDFNKLVRFPPTPEALLQKGPSFPFDVSPVQSCLHQATVSISEHLKVNPEILGVWLIGN